MHIAADPKRQRRQETSPSFYSHVRGGKAVVPGPGGRLPGEVRGEPSAREALADATTFGNRGVGLRRE